MIIRQLPSWRHVVVIGVGLIGGSFAAAIKRAGLAQRISGIAPGASLAQALSLGLLDDGAACALPASGQQAQTSGGGRLLSDDVNANPLQALLASADLIVLAAPVMSLPGWLQTIAPLLAPQAIVTDCASTKLSVIDAAQRHLGPASTRFVAGHPIAGSERSGAAAARADLFDQARVILCPHPMTGGDAHARIAATWTAIGALVSDLDAARHDRLYAAVSHWPHVLAFALTAALARSDVADDALAAAGAGLRDTTRIAASSPTLWAEIVLDNRAQVLAAADEFALELTQMLTALRDGNRAQLEAQFERAAGWRRKLK